MKFWKNIFKKKLKSFLVNDQYKVTEAFKWGGKTYYQFEDAFNMPSGRGLMALAIYEEFRMRVTNDYLDLHTRAMDKLMEPSKTINIGLIALLNQNLKDRLQLAPFPDHMFKLASITYFDETESPYAYDQKYNEKKIKDWKTSGGMFDFFSQLLLPELMPSLKLSGINAETYSLNMENLSQRYLKVMSDILSNKA